MKRIGLTGIQITGSNAPVSLMGNAITGFTNASNISSYSDASAFGNLGITDCSPNSPMSPC
jgi:hypothetical protein